MRRRKDMKFSMRFIIFHDIIHQAFMLRRRDKMKCTLIYWIDDGWYIGRLKEIPGVATQGETLEELKENIEDAYKMMMEEYTDFPQANIETMEISLDVA
jgi:predicted RNase H-like HicB family nuclease